LQVNCVYKAIVRGSTELITGLVDTELLMEVE
jgi:hypothetical protein